MSTLLQDLRSACDVGQKPRSHGGGGGGAGVGHRGEQLDILGRQRLAAPPILPFQRLDRLVDHLGDCAEANEYRIAPAPANFAIERRATRSRSWPPGHGWEVNVPGYGVRQAVDGFQVTPDFFPLPGHAGQRRRTISSRGFRSGSRLGSGSQLRLLAAAAGATPGWSVPGPPERPGFPRSSA